jgi:hypothetical protein
VSASVDRITREFDGTVLVLHQSKKAEGNTIRESSALLGAMDTALPSGRRLLVRRQMTRD